MFLISLSTWSNWPPGWVGGVILRLFSFQHFFPRALLHGQKLSVVGWWGGGPCDFSVTPSPLTGIWTFRLWTWAWQKFTLDRAFIISQSKTKLAMWGTWLQNSFRGNCLNRLFWYSSLETICMSRCWQHIERRPPSISRILSPQNVI